VLEPCSTGEPRGRSIIPKARKTATPFLGFLLALATQGLLACASLPSIPLGLPVRWPDGGSDYPPPAEDLRGAAAEILARAIRFDTTNPPGNEAALAEWLAEVLKREGVEARAVRLEENQPKRAALWARVKGNGRSRPVVLLSHLDVVPADAAQWSLDPLAGVVGGGFVVGRGALDAKGIAVVHALTLAALARRAPLDRDVILLSTPDEEQGGAHGAARVVDSHRALLGGAEFLLGEGGGIRPGAEGPDVWGVSYTEKPLCWLELRTRGVGGHGAAGSGNAAPARLVRALSRVLRMEHEIRVTPEVARMFEALSPLAPALDRENYRTLRSALALNPDFRRRYLADPGREALVRNTVALTMLQGSPRVNVVPATARATLDVRLLPDESCGGFVEELRAAVDDSGVEIEPLLQFAASASPVETPLMDAIRRVAARRDPPGVVAPRVIAGFTDAHWFRRLGIVAYGFVPHRLRPVETHGIHGPNERISMDNLVLGVEIMLEILAELDRTPAPR